MSSRVRDSRVMPAPDTGVRGRRSVLRAALASASAAVLPSAFCQSTRATPAPTAGQDGGDVRPYVQVKPVAGEADVVRVFFSPKCPFSKQYFPFFHNLQVTLPAAKRFEFSALVNHGDGVDYALAFELVRLHFPAYVANFVDASLQGVQDQGLNTLRWRDVDQIAKAAHIPASIARLVDANRTEAKERVEQAIRRQSALQVTNTPTVAVAGTYVVTPEYTSGDAAMFSRLVNGLISMTL